MGHCPLSEKKSQKEALKKEKHTPFRFTEIRCKKTKVYLEPITDMVVC